MLRVRARTATPGSARSASRAAVLLRAHAGPAGRGRRRPNRDRVRKEQSMRETVIVSAVRTPTGKFLGGLKDFKATELGALAVREAVRRAGIDPGVRRRVHHGQRRQRRRRTGARAAGGAPRRPRQRRRRADDQQGVRLGPEGRDARDAGHRARRHRHRRRRRHGVDEQLPVPADARARRACAWATAPSSIR